MTNEYHMSVSVLSISEDKSPITHNGQIYPRALKIRGRLTLTLASYPFQIDVHLIREIGVLSRPAVSLMDEFANPEVSQDFEITLPIPEEGEYQLMLAATGGNPDDGTFLRTFAQGPMVRVIAG